MRKLLAIILLASGYLINFAQPTQAALSNWLGNYQTELSWQIAPEVATQITHFDFLIDSQVALNEIANQDFLGTNYSLRHDGAGRYDFTFTYQFTPGNHTWNLHGFNEQGVQILQTDDQTITIAPTINWQQLIADFIAAIKLHRQMIITSLVGLGTLIFGIFFGLFFILDLIFSKGGNLAARINWRDRLKLKHTGFIYDVKTNLGVPFALITATGRDLVGHAITITSVSDVNGVYDEIVAPKGTYQLVASKPNFIFPTRRTRPSILPADDFYKGEPIKLKHTWSTIYPTIPLDQTAQTSPDLHRPPRLGDVFWQKWKSMAKKQGYFELIMFALSIGGGAILQQGIFGVVGLIYGLFLIRRLLSLIHTPNLVGKVVDEVGRGISDAVIEAFNTDEDERHIRSMMITNKQGEFYFHLQPGTYNLRAQKNGYLAPKTGLSTNVEDSVQISSNTRAHKQLTLVPLTNSGKDFFTMLDQAASHAASPAPLTDPPPPQS